MKSDPRSYRLSFTVGGLLLHESIVLAEAWVARRDWRGARAAVPDNLFVATGGVSSASRLRNEAIRRLRTLDEAEHCAPTDSWEWLRSIIPRLTSRSRA